MKGYYISTGYKGYIPGMGYILFCTQQEYIEYFNEMSKGGKNYAQI